MSKSDRMRIGVPDTLGTHERAEIVLDFGRIFGILKRGWWLIIGFGLIGAVVAAVFVLQVTPTYRSGAELLLGQKSRIDDTMGALFEELRLDEAAISGEVAIITSGRILSRVSEKLELENHPEFNPALRPPEPEDGFFATLQDQVVTGIRGMIGLEKPTPTGPIGVGQTTLSAAQSAALSGRLELGQQGEYARQLRQGLRVRQVGRSNVLSLRYTSTDRVLAAAVPNALMDIYLEDQLNRQFDLVGRVTTGLQARLNGLRDRLEAAEQLTIDYRTESLSLGYGSRQQLDRQLTDVASRLSQASADYARFRAELEAIDALLVDEGPVAIAGLFGSASLDELRDELSALSQRVVRLRTQFGEDAVQVVQTENEIARLEAVIASEVTRLRDDKARQISLAGAARDALTAELSDLEKSAVEQARREVRLTQLEREQEAAETIYRTFLERFNQTRESGDLQETDAQILNYALPPTAPVAPDKKMAVALGGIGGGFVGVAFAFLIALTDKRIRSADRLTSFAPGIEVVSMPAVGRRFLRKRDPLLVALHDPKAPLTESLRSLRSNILLNKKKSGSTIISFVSAKSGAGKTTTTINMGRLLTRMDQSCVIIDADQRRGNVAMRLGLSPAPTMRELVAGKVMLKDTMRQDRATGLSVISVGIDEADPSSTLLDGFAGVVEQLKAEFDFILIDTAPLWPVSDALPAVHLSDRVVMMVPWGSPEEDLIAARRILARAKGTISSFVLSFSPKGAATSYY